MGQRIKMELNVFQLKMIALFFMTLDHIAAFGLVPASLAANMGLRVSGRIAAPLFLFLLTEGLHHTTNRLRYLVRLWACGSLIQCVNLFFKCVIAKPPFCSVSNIIPTFMYVALYVICMEELMTAVKNRDCRKLCLSIAGMALPFLTTFLALCVEPMSFVATCVVIFACPMTQLEYSVLFVILGVIWYFMDNQEHQCLLLAALSLLCCFVSDTMSAQFTGLLAPVQSAMICAIPFISFYSGEKGRDCKYLFYFYYPLHQYLICLLAALAFH